MLAFGVSLLQLQMFFLVFLRTGAFLMALPLVNAPSVPVFFRIGLTFVVSLLLFPVLNLGPLPFLADAFSLAVAAAGEILLGVLAGLVVGLLVSIFQSATSINEMTMTFIPKMLAVAAALVFFFPWMMQTMVSFTEQMFMGMNQFIR